MEINKRKVRLSMWIPIPVVFLLMICMGIVEGIMTPKGIDIVEIAGTAFFMMLMGIIVWGPSLLVCLLMEWLMINEETTKGMLAGILILEALVPVLLFVPMANMMTWTGAIVPLVIALLAQGVRWGYLTYKYRMFVPGV